jgi:adenosylcobinamide kinase/adenosylcobinamide-phosphate guanylyltransferase
LLWRRWAGRTEPLEVFGPRAALAALASWLPTDDPGVTFRPLAAGETGTLGHYTVRALAAEHDSEGALLYDVTDAGGHRLLYATDTGPGFEIPKSARYDLLLLEETWGDSPTQTAGGHHDLGAFARTLARLRGTGALDERSRVAAIHLGHGNPPPSDLRRRLADWGAELPLDGAVFRTGEPLKRGGRPRRTLVLGGARSGKSMTAERMLAAEPEVCYVATAAVAEDDPEWSSRIAAHVSRRPTTWHTLESIELAQLLGERTAADPPLLIDCLTVWLSRIMDRVGVWSTGDETEKKAADAALAEAIDRLVGSWRTTRARVIAVSNEVGSGVVPEHPSGRRFRDELGALNAALAAASDDVVLVTAGIATSLRPVARR